MIWNERNRANASMTEPTYLGPVRRSKGGLIAPAAAVPIVVLALLLSVPGLPTGTFVPGGAGGLVSSGAPTAPVASSPAAASSGALHLGAARVAELLQPLAVPSAGAPAFAGGPSGPARLAPAPDATSSNFLVTGSDCATFGIYTPFEPQPFAASSITAVGGSSTTLEAASGSVYGVFNVSGSTPCDTLGASESGYFESHGATVLYHSTDGGNTWSSTALVQNKTHWQNTADPTNGTENWGNPTVVSTASGVLLASELGMPNCWFNLSNYPNFPTCDNTTLGQPFSVAVARSTDGGVTWSVPAQVGTIQATEYLTIPSACSTEFPDGSGWYRDDWPDFPTVAVNPVNGVAITAWSFTHLSFDLTNCTVAFGGSTIYSRSTDNGITWGTQQAVATGFESYPRIAIGPAPTYPISIVMNDWGNGTSTSTSWSIVRSTNNGTTWTSPADIAVGAASVEFGVGPFFVPPETFFGLQVPSYAVDTSSTSTYEGHQYVAWSQNGSSNFDIDLVRNTGTGWTAPVKISSGSTNYYISPSLAVDPAGSVWVTYYGYNPNSEIYSYYGVVSTDGGATWSGQFTISDTASSPPSNFADLGVWAGVVGTSNGIYPIWTDCRSTACSSDNDVQLYGANVHAVSITSNIPGVTANVTTAGVKTAYTLNVTLGWDNASTHTVAVPQYVTDLSNASAVWSFTGYTGLSSDTNVQTTVSFAGTGSTLTANYAEVPAAILKGTFYPSAAGASLTINGISTPLTTYDSTHLQYTKSVASGLSYTLVASAPSYVAQTHTIPTSSGGVYWWNFTLSRQTGNISGTIDVYPASVGLSSVALTVNGTAVTTVNPTTGFFSVPEPFGWYWLNASAGAGLTTCDEYLQVVSGGTTVANLAGNVPGCGVVSGHVNLTGGWISGDVPTGIAGIVVRIDNAMSVAIDGTTHTFNMSVIGGYHNVTATAPGYNLSTFPHLYVAPAAGVSVSVKLTNQGWIAGIITPTDAIGAAKLHIYSASAGTGGFYAVNPDGTFNESFVGDLNYTVNVTADGYSSYQTVVKVSAGNGSVVTAGLTKNPTGCTGPNCPGSGGGGGGTNSSGSGFTTTDLLIIVVVIVLVAVVLAVLLMRRGGGGGASAPAEEPPIYDESVGESAPRLQADGSMGSGSSPPPPGVQ